MYILFQARRFKFWGLFRPLDCFRVFVGSLMPQNRTYPCICVQEAGWPGHSPTNLSNELANLHPSLLLDELKRRLQGHLDDCIVAPVQSAFFLGTFCGRSQQHSRGHGCHHSWAGRVWRFPPSLMSRSTLHIASTEHARCIICM